MTSQDDVLDTKKQFTALWNKKDSSREDAHILGSLRHQQPQICGGIVRDGVGVWSEGMGYWVELWGEGEVVWGYGG